MIKFKIGRDNDGVITFLTHEDLVTISKDKTSFKSKYNNQQWAKIRKLIKKEVN